jgi:hypothetical protein
MGLVSVQWHLVLVGYTADVSEIVTISIFSRM